MTVSIVVVAGAMLVGLVAVAIALGVVAVVEHLVDHRTADDPARHDRSPR